MKEIKTRLKMKKLMKKFLLEANKHGISALCMMSDEHCFSYGTEGKDVMIKFSEAMAKTREEFDRLHFSGARSHEVPGQIYPL